MDTPLAEYFPIPDWYKRRLREIEYCDSTDADAVYANLESILEKEVPTLDISDLYRDGRTVLFIGCLIHLCRCKDDTGTSSFL